MFCLLNNKLSALLASLCPDELCFTCFFCVCACVWERLCVYVCSFSSFCEFLGNFRVWLRLTPVSSCVSCVGLLVQDLTDTILSSYAYKSHYLLTESNRAELKLPMIPSPSSATKKNVGKGNCTVFLFLLYPTGLCLCCACSRPDLVYRLYASFISKPWGAKLIIPSAFCFILDLTDRCKSHLN